MGNRSPLAAVPPPFKTRAGRRRLDERREFTGILFVLQSGISWEYLLQEMDCGFGMTCWSRERDWQTAGVWEWLHRDFAAKLGDAVIPSINSATVI